MQKANAAQYGLNADIPEEATAANLFYLADQMITFGNNLPVALAATKTGPGVMKEAIRATRSTDWTVLKAYLREVLSEKAYNQVSGYPDEVIAASTSLMQPSDQGYINLLVSNGLISV